MQLYETEKTSPNLGEHRYAFGYLRLILASLVIISHTPALLNDGSRDPLIAAFGGFGIGHLAVLGFFIISGFLITGSYINSSSLRSYLTKRFSRIYPAYIVAFLFCLLVAAPLGGGAIDGNSWGWILLRPPVNISAFQGTAYSGTLNGSMWTIQIEFLCYLVVVAIGLVGLLKKPMLLAAGSVSCLLAHTVAINGFGVTILPGGFQKMELLGVFLAGAAFYGLQGRIGLSWFKIAASTVGLILCLSYPPFATIGCATFGSYLVFAAAAWGAETWIANVNNKTDISYGVYLYAFPVTKLLIWYGVSNALMVNTLTWGISAVLGYLSWVLIEKPVMRLARSPALRALVTTG